MSWKKNTFSYLLWVFYAVTAEVGLVCLADSVCDSAGVELYIGTVFCALYIILSGVGVYLVHRFAPKYSGADEKHRSMRAVIETAATVFLLILGFVLRAQSAGGAGEENVYYELAVMVSEEEIPRLAHGAGGIYIQMLHGLFYFLGNKPAVAVWVQILLQMSAMLVLYFAVRRSAGSIAAIVMLGFSMLSSYMIEEAFRMSPAMLYLFLWSAALLLIVTVGRAKRSLWGFLLAGFVISFVSYLDVAGCLLLFVSAAVIFCEDEASENGGRLKRLILCLLGAGVGFVGWALADSLMSGKIFTETLAGWFQLYRPSDFQLPVSADAAGTMAEAMAEYIILFCVLTLGMFSFWRNRRSDHMKAWILLLIVLMSAGCFGIFTEEMPMGLYLYLLLAVMAGIAVEECICEIRPAPGAALPMPAEAGLSEGAAAESHTDRNVVSQAQGRAETGGADTAQHKEADNASQADGKAAPQPGKVKLIENPLPLPKKHVKRKLDYSVDVPAGKEDFDLEVDEKDDFDI